MSLSQTADEKIDALTVELDEIRQTLEFIKAQGFLHTDHLEFIKETIVKADTTITKVAAEVMPTINQLMESPMIKMLAGKRK